MDRLFGRASASAALVFLAAACGTSESLGLGGTNNGGNNAIAQSEYDIASKKWQTGAPSHYRIVVAQTCECTVDFQRPTRVTVRRVGGPNVENIEEVVDAATLAPVSDDRRMAAKSVDGLLVVIGQWLQVGPQDVRITYDATLGYPISVNIDPVTSIAGDEVVYKVTSFETLPP
jgi:hypothetical protein